MKDFLGTLGHFFETFAQVISLMVLKEGQSIIKPEKLFDF